jgi:hypothetical protein
MAGMASAVKLHENIGLPPQSNRQSRGRNKKWELTFLLAKMGSFRAK